MAQSPDFIFASGVLPGFCTIIVQCSGFKADDVRSGRLGRVVLRKRCGDDDLMSFRYAGSRTVQRVLQQTGELGGLPAIHSMSRRF